MTEKQLTLSPRLKTAMHDINSRFGTGTITLLGQDQSYNIEYMATGLKGLDAIIGGGLPKSSLVEVYGDPGSGKSTLALIMIAAVQRAGGSAAYFDAEHGFDSAWAKRFGVDLETLAFSQPDTGEQCIDAALALIKANIDLIVIDSVSALTPRKELEDIDDDEGVDKDHMALQARLMAKTCRLMLTLLKKRKTVVVFINQFTTTIGALAFFGTPAMATKGGKALKQKSRMRLEVLNTKFIEREAAAKAGALKGRIGHIVQIRVTKSKVSPPYRLCQFQIMYYSAAALTKMGVKLREEQRESRDGNKSE